MNTLLVKKRGNGANGIVALHGWAGDHRAFSPVLRHLPADTTIYLVDQPGCGQSAPPAVWTTEAIAAPIADFVRELPHERVTIAGACSGAVVGLYVALAVPDRVERLSMIDPFLVAPWYLSLFTIPALGALFYWSTFANPLGRWITNVMMRKRKRAGVDVTSGFDRLRHANALRYLRALKDTPLPAEDALRSLDGRVDVAVGEKTFAAVRRSVDEFVRRFWPSTRVTVLRGAGHLPLLETPRLVAETLSCPTSPNPRTPAVA